MDGGADLGPVSIPTWIDVSAVFMGALAGSLLATRKKLDVTGILMLAIVSGLGGGILRDTLLQRGTPAALVHSSYLIAAFSAASIGFFFANQVARVSWAFAIIDALSLGLYSLVGALKAVDAELPMLSVLLIAVITATGGGLLRDVLLTSTPSILLPGAPYAVLALIGGILVLVLDAIGTSEEWLWWAPVAIVVVLRAVALYYGWQTPMATDLPAHMGAIVPEGAIPGPLKEIHPSRFVPPVPRFGNGEDNEMEADKTNE
jgi:uncharacterized membrane protein YeiH